MNYVSVSIIDIFQIHKKWTVVYIINNIFKWFSDLNTFRMYYSTQPYTEISGLPGQF